MLEWIWVETGTWFEIQPENPRIPPPIIPYYFNIK
jgi:hypothetical protein